MFGGPGSSKCPGCGAQLGPAPAGGHTRCEYCGLQLGTPSSAQAFPPPPSLAALGLPSAPRPPAAPVLRRRSRAKVIVIVALVLLVGAPVAYLIWYMSWSRVDGSVRSDGGPLGTWSAPLAACNSGSAFVPQFFGVDLQAESPRAHLQVQGGESGKATVVVAGPQGDEPHVDLGARDCAVFDVFVDWSGAEINDVSAVKGHLHIDCTLPDGGRIRADAEFNACH